MSKTLSLDDIRDMLLSGKYVASPETAQTLGIYIHHNPQRFNFGSIPFDIVKQGADDARPFIKAKLFTLPFDKALFRVNEMLSDGTECPTTILATTDLDAFGVDCSKMDMDNPDFKSPDEMTLVTGAFFGEDGSLIAITFFINHSLVVNNSYVIGVPPSELEFMANVQTRAFPERSRDVAMKSVEDIVKQIAMSFFGLVGILNTKHVPKTVAAPSAKHNAQRVKNGKLPLPYVTTINTAKYVAAVRNVAGATGGNRRPHMRRAHIRTIQQPSGPKDIGVSACYINWDGLTPLQRKEYEVTP